MTRFKYYISAIGGVVAAYFKMYGLAFTLVGVAVLFDIVTGVLASILNGGGLTSAKAYRGVIKKLVLFIALGFGTFLDVFIPYAAQAANFTIPKNLLFSTVICVYITVTESISIIENIYRCNGAALPKWLLKMLKTAQNEMNEENKK